MRQARGAKPLAWLIVSQALALASLMPWFEFSQFATVIPVVGIVMAPIIWSYPLLMLACFWVTWQRYVQGNVSGALGMSWLPAMVAVPMLVFASFIRFHWFL